MEHLVAGPPERSLAQRMDALRRANDVRIARSRLKRQMKAREVSVDEVLRRPTPEVFNMPVRELLLATPKIGGVKANQVLGYCNVSPTKRIGGLTDRQRAALIRTLPRYARGM